jgi:uncharacterized membrane protein
MSNRAAVTVNRPREDVERQWRSSDPLQGSDAKVTFRDAPGDRGTEIHVDVEAASGGRLSSAVRKLRGADPLAKAKDELRRFKQRVETGVIPRSDAAPEGELAERKLKQRPAQPLEDAELRKAGVS